MSHQIIRSWYTDRRWVGCYIWYSEKGTGRGCSPPKPLLDVPNVTAHPSTASTVLLYNGPLLCVFNVPVKGLTSQLSVSLMLLLQVIDKYWLQHLQHLMVTMATHRRNILRRCSTAAEDLAINTSLSATATL